VDVTSLGTSINHTLNTLKIYFRRSDSFAEGAIHLTKFLQDSKDGFLENVDKEETIHKHDLLYILIDDEKMSQLMETCIDGSFKSCIQITRNYVLRENNTKHWIERFF
jgi:hypothetical protein